MYIFRVGLWILAVLCLVVAVVCLLASTGGDNDNARALSKMFLLPAGFFGTIGVTLFVLAWLLL